MEYAPQQALDEIKRLQGCINNLISVQALLAIWSGPRAGEIMNTLLDALIRVLHLTFACARVKDSLNGPPIEVVRLPLPNSPDHDLQQVRMSAVWLKGDLPTNPIAIENPIGTGMITIAPIRLGLEDEIGVVLAASERADFPSQLEMIVLLVATNQAVVGLQEARLLKGAEDRLRRSEAQLAEGQRLSHSGSWGWNVSSGELIFSYEAFRILGFDPDRPAPSFRTVMDRFHADDREPVERILEAAIREKEPYEFETRLALPDGSVRHVRCVGRPVTNKPGDLEFIGTLLDITDSKKAEERLQAAQVQLAHMARVTTMGELAASIAHEVNQPLGAMVTDGSACLRWLNRPEPDLEEARTAVARMIKEATRASQVIGRIRSLAKKSPLQMTVLDMNKAIKDAMVLTRHQILKNGILVKTELAADLRPALGDLVQLQQVIVNLIMNAVEAISVRSEGPRDLLVSSQNQGPDQIVIHVRDSGAGIDPSRLDQIFQPFVTSKPDGMGMGLSISRSIIEAHGGRLSAMQNEGLGATFRFSLRVAEGDGLQ